MDESFDVKVVEESLRLGRIEDVSGFVHAELFEDDGQLVLEHFLDPMLYRAFKDEVHRTNHVCLSDAIHPTDALFDPHGNAIFEMNAQEQVRVAEVDGAVVRKWREDFPALRDMR